MADGQGYFVKRGKFYLSFFLVFIFLVFSFGFWNYYDRGVLLHSMSSLEDRFSSLSSDYAQLSDDYNGARSTVSSLRSSLSVLRSDHTILRRETAALALRLEGKDERISFLESEILGLESRLASLDDNVDTESGNESEIARLQSRISSLEDANRRLMDSSVAVSSGEGASAEGGETSDMGNVSAQSTMSFEERLRRRLNELRLIENQNANLRLRLRRLTGDLVSARSALASASSVSNVASASDGALDSDTSSSSAPTLVSDPPLFSGGIDLPACWSREDGESKGKPEYLFDIDLTKSGIIVSDRFLPHRSDAFSFLPDASIPRNEALSSEDFLIVTAPLFSWSVSNSCRFFVRICDRTPDNNKSFYKDLLRSIESRFYKYERSDCEDV